jgi:hypothetical protein
MSCVPILIPSMCDGSIPIPLGGSAACAAIPKGVHPSIEVRRREVRGIETQDAATRDG